MELLAFAATELANADVPIVPENIVSGLALARLTALRKPDGGVRGVATFSAAMFRGPYMGARVR